MPEAHAREAHAPEARAPEVRVPEASAPADRVPDRGRVQELLRAAVRNARPVIHRDVDPRADHDPL